MISRALRFVALGFVYASYAQGQNITGPPGSDSSGAQVTGLTGAVGLGITESDNIYRTDGSHVSDAIGQVIADLDIDEDTRLIQAKAASNLAFLEYQNNDYASEVLGNFYGAGRLSISPDRFSWVLQENFGQQQITPGVPPTPLNLQNVNFVSTGPDITIPIVGQTDIRLSGRYSNVAYQTLDLNNNRADGTVSIIENFSASANLSANAGIESVRYQDSVANPNFETQQAYLDLESKGARTTLSIMGGADRVTGLLDEPTQPLVRLSIEHAISESSKINLAAGQDFSDSGSMLVQLQQLNGLTYGAAQSVTSSDPFTDRYGRFGWQFDRLRTVVGFDVARYQEVHLIETQYDQVRWVADVNLSRRMTPSLTGTIQGGYLNDTYNTAAYSYKALVGSAALNWQVGKRLNLQFIYQHFGQTANARVDEFGENRISAIVSYAVGRVRPITQPALESIPATP